MFSDTPSEEDQDQSTQTQQVEEEKMVATRRGGAKPATQEVDEEDSINVYVPQTPKRKLGSLSKIQDSEEEQEFHTPPTSKKLRVGKRNTPRVVGGDTLSTTRPVVEIPAIIPPVVDYVEVEGVDETRKILDPLPVRTRMEETKISAVAVQTLEVVVEEKETSKLVLNPDLSVVEEESLEEIEEVNQPGEEQDDEVVFIRETVLAPEPERTLPEPIQIDTIRVSSDNSKSQTTDTIVPLLPQIPHKSTLPYLLPAELLQDEDTISTTEPDDMKLQIKPKKTKFFDEVAVSSTPKDRQIGSTTYRVTKSSTLLLAPKASARSRSKKEAWLQGRTTTKGDNHRKPFSEGFFLAKR